MYEDYYGMQFLASNLIEEEDREPSFTGILSASGKKIMRIVPPKPKIGFPIHPEDNEGYDFDPEYDFMYVELN